MEMKKIYKSLMILAAALTLPLMLNAQTATPPKYKYDSNKHVGYNKYLVSDTPDENGEYTLRIENFITGQVEAKARPTDFVMVLDVSGSMLYDHKLRGQQVPIAIKKSVNDAKDDKDVSKLRLDDGCGREYTHYTAVNYYSGGEVGSKFSGTAGTQWQAKVTNTPTHNGNVGVSNRWYLYENVYYRIFRNTSGGNYYLYFDLVDDNLNRIIENGQPKRRYLKQDGNDIVVTETMPTVYAENIVQLIDNRNNSGYKLYRYANRKDALIKGVNTFLNMILEQNTRDEIWEDDVTRHQVAVVAFGGCAKGAISLTGGTTSTRVAKVFAEITDGNVNEYKNWDAGIPWNAGTDVGRGVETGRRLFQNLVVEHPEWCPLNGLGKRQRNKVMVVFTDGEPNAYTAKNTDTGYLGIGGHCAYAIGQGNIVKQTGKLDPNGKYTPENQAINALLYTINLSNVTTYVPAFLQHLSSDYPQATSSVQTGQDVGGAANQFGGTIGEKTGYYMDATAMNDLSDAFGAIASDNTGEMASKMVSVDQVTSDFVIPFTSADLDKVKVYTAQCIGLTGETFLDEQGHEHHELAFAQEIEAGERPIVEHLWVYDNDANDWVDHQDFYIDNEIEFEVSDDHKSITLQGFDYGDLWCGEDLAHNNSRHIVATSDPNYDNQKLGYRGFKMIYEFPIKIDPDALGGSDVPTNTASSGLWKATNTGVPTDQQVEYPKPVLTVPVRLIVQKTGLTKGESANFTVQRKSRTDDTDVYRDFMTFVLSGETSTEIRIPNLDPAYYYKVKEGNWSWTYENVSNEYYTTDPDDNPAPANPIVFKNKPIPDTPKHAEAKSTNVMHETEYSTTAE